MYEPLLERIRNLERANRRWKVVAAFLGAALLGLLLTGGVLLGVFGRRALVEREHALRAMEEARMMELVARQQADRARIEAERALQEAKRGEQK